VAQLPQIAALEQRRRRLVERGERHRQEIGAALDQLRSAAAWVETGYSVAQTIGTYAPLLTTVAGLVRGRRKGSLLRLLGKGWTLWRLGKRLSRLWARRGGEREGDHLPKQ
jgi:hypothetical protein